jgi:replicative DNA helicase
MPDSEMALISRMIETAGVDKVISAGVEPRHFSDDDLRRVYETCVQHYSLWRRSPSLEAVKRRHPDYKRVVVHDDLGYLIDEFRTDSTFREAQRLWDDLGRFLDEAEQDPAKKREILPLAMEHYRDLGMRIPTPNAARYSDMITRVNEIRRQQEAGVLPGIRIGIPCLDPWIHVVRKSEFVVFCAYSGHGKTTGLVRSIIQAYREGEVCLLQSLEMDADEVFELFDAEAAKLSRTAIRQREIGDEDWGRYEETAARVTAAKNEIVVIDDSEGPPTVDKLASKIEQYGATTVGVDYLSLMASHAKTDKDWERVTVISRSLKQLARSMRVRVYAAAQNSKDAIENGPTENNIAFSTSIFQDCNVMIGFWESPEMAKKNKVEVRVVKNRAARKPPYKTLYEYWDRDVMSFETWTRQHDWIDKLT